MAKTAKDFSTSSLSFDFTMPDTEDIKIPRMQIRSYRVVPNQLISSDNLDFENAGKSSRQHSMTITLPLPDELKFANQFEWQTDNRALLQNILGNFNGSDSSSQLTGDSGLLESVLMRTASNLGTFGGDSVMRNAGYATDPLKEMFFTGHDYRTFNWSWDLNPRNQSEGSQMMRAMRKLDVDSRPEKYNRGTNILPNEFEVAWINCRLPKLMKLVCTDTNFDYASSGAGSRFKADGTPSSMTMSLGFKEIEIVDRLAREEGEW